MSKMMLIVTDAHSKWPEVTLTTSTTAIRTITVLQGMFAQYGIPEQVVSDNGPQFVSAEFKSFMKHIRSAPYLPSTNGAAERLVQTVKGVLRSGHQQGMPLELALVAFFLGYRTTPHSTTGVAPSTLFLGCDLWT